MDYTPRLVTILLSGLAVLPAASAEPAPASVIVWPTFLRTAPSERAVVIDELARDQTVRVLACDRGWCRVTVGHSGGYVDAARLGPPQAFRAIAPAPAASTAATTPACFTSVRAGAGKGQTFDYCPDSTRRAAPPAPASPAIGAIGGDAVPGR